MSRIQVIVSEGWVKLTDCEREGEPDRRRARRGRRRRGYWHDVDTDHDDEALMAKVRKRRRLGEATITSFRSSALIPNTGEWGLTVSV